MYIDDQENVIPRLLKPEPLPIGFKRRHPKAYRYTPYSRKIMRRLDLYTSLIYDLWIHIEWDRKVLKFNERVQKLTIPENFGKVVNLTPAIVTVDENKKVCIHILLGSIEDPTARKQYAIQPDLLLHVEAFASSNRFEVATWTPEKIYANNLELEGWKQLLRFICIPELIVPLALQDRVTTILRHTRKITIAALLESLPDDDPDWVMRTIAVMLQEGLIYADIAKFPLGYATELSAFHEFT